MGRILLSWLLDHGVVGTCVVHSCLYFECYSTNKSYADTWWSEFGKHVMVAQLWCSSYGSGLPLGSGSFVQNS
jgi:hypothetical protein